MAWPGEAFVLDEDCRKVALPASALEALDAAGVEWVVTRRCRDLSLLAPGGVLDVTALAHRLFTRHQAVRAGVIMDVACVDSPVVARQYGS
eukprot:336769-Chlamydomonas_euryale.AAC.1